MANQRARQLRQTMTAPEVRIWSRLRPLRSRGIHIRRQAPIGPYIADFCCHRAKTVIEIDGGQHGRAAQQAVDRRRTAWLESQGYCVLRFWNDDVLTNLDGVIETVVAVLSRRLASPPPGDAAHRHPPHGGGGNT
ncbi:MAG: DUF559 domain-containing protein [Rhodospirillaceae bacterium]|nr:DUF559 domain-containing protein [Rhodospirillaceae bacterium]